MKIKRVLAFFVTVVMLISLLPAVELTAAKTDSVIKMLGGEVLWSAPDDNFYDAEIAEAFPEWYSFAIEGYVNVRTYPEGTTVQYYVNGTDSVTGIFTPCYGKGKDKIIIEWVMRRQNAAELHFNFGFYDINSTLIASLPLNNAHTSITSGYPMGYPDNGAKCAIVAYNNSDGETHTVEYYINGEMVSKKEALSGAIDGFYGISSSEGAGNSNWAHIGFANLTIGAADDAEYVNVTASYEAEGEVIATKTYSYIAGGNGAVFEKQSFYHNGEVWYAPEVTLKESGTVEALKQERYKTKNTGDVFTLDNTAYRVKGESAILNGNFSTGDTICWTNRQGTSITDCAVTYSEDINGNMISLSAGGKDATDNIGTIWSVKAGQKYYLSFYAGGDKPDSHNYVYNQLFQSDKSTAAFSFGENMVEGEWVRFEEIIIPTSDTLYFQCSWTGLIHFGNFELLPVEEYTEDVTEEPTEEPTDESSDTPSEEPTEEPSEEPTRYEVIEDAFVQYNRIYGINRENTSGLMIGSYSDENRGPEYDANGETTYLGGATPTTLGSTRVGLVKFPVMDIEEDERAVLKLYVRDWHQQGFDGGNTFLRIAATPLEDSSWADQSEGSWLYIADEPLLEGWGTPVFSEKAAKKTGYVNVDVTEIMHAAKRANKKYISFKLQIYWGAAYCVEREAAVSGGSYEGLSAYIELKEESLKHVTVSGDATLTKNGAAMNGFAYVSDSDDVRLQLEDAQIIGAEEGCYVPNEKLTFSADTEITDTFSMGFGLTMVDGAQVRYGGGVDNNGNVGSGNGLRFITLVDKADTLAGMEEAELGVIISAEDSDSTITIKAEKWQNDTTFTSALTNLSVSNYNRRYTATPYAKVGEKTFTGESVTRSIYQVASGLLIKEDPDYSEEDTMLLTVLNAYVNQVGIRLVFSDNAEFTDWELRANTNSKGAYTGECFFEVGETEVDGKVYSVKLTPRGNNTVIRTENGYWNEYIRINNNNSQTKLCTTLTDNGDGTYTLSFDTEMLNMGTYPEEKIRAMKPTYEKAVAAMEKANSYWQKNNSYTDWYGGAHPAFWDKAAYHTGNVEMYKVTGNEEYLQYTIDWANYNNWMGNNSTSDPSTWTWGYNQNQGSNAVLFGDWQTCFQVYLDLYDLGIEGAKIDRVKEVMDYQVSKENDDFWWWADALYMVMPVMSKLYKETGDEKYLDALYKYFRYAKELMYDGPGGIPESKDGYTTSASLRSGASYSDPDDYKYLFFRDAGYVYPLNPNPGHADEKNFWARGNGWVFAGLIRVLEDMPETYEHYDEFYNTYIEMAEAIVSCQMVDDKGYGFWTQSMLQDYPKGTNGNDEGYETSGTAFFAYGLFKGINSGILTDTKYELAAIRTWGYLEKVALHESGKVGYVQPIGSNATQATSYDTTVNFGVGAYLLAASEAALWAKNQ